MNFVWREGVKIKIELLGDTLEEMNTDRQREEWGGGGGAMFHVILKSERKSHESDFHKISFFFMNNTPQ